MITSIPKPIEPASPGFVILCKRGRSRVTLSVSKPIDAASPGFAVLCKRGRSRVTIGCPKSNKCASPGFAVRAGAYRSSEIHTLHGIGTYQNRGRVIKEGASSFVTSSSDLDAIVGFIGTVRAGSQTTAEILYPLATGTLHVYVLQDRRVTNAEAQPIKGASSGYSSGGRP